MRKSVNSVDILAGNRFVSLSDEEILAAWCMCTTRHDSDEELRFVRAELKRRKMFLPFN